MKNLSSKIAVVFAIISALALAAALAALFYYQAYLLYLNPSWATGLQMAATYAGATLIGILANDLLWRSLFGKSYLGFIKLFFTKNDTSKYSYLL